MLSDFSRFFIDAQVQIHPMITTANSSMDKLSKAPRTATIAPEPDVSPAILIQAQVTLDLQSTYTTYSINVYNIDIEPPMGFIIICTQYEVVLMANKL